MPKIYSAAEIRCMAERDEKVNAMLVEITNKAREMGPEDGRTLVTLISPYNPMYNTLVRRLRELGYKVTYTPPGPTKGGAYTTIEW